MTTRFESYCARQNARHDGQFTQAELDPRFIEAYNKGDTYRLKIRFSYGREAWGYVAATTGWRPSFMLMRRRGQRGSSELLGPKDVIVASKTI